MVAYKTTNPELIDWLTERLDHGNLSQSEASRRAGLGLNAISEIMNGRTPGLKVCGALAEFFNVPADYVMRLAGHLPPEVQINRSIVTRVSVAKFLKRLEEALILSPELAQQIENDLEVQSEVLGIALDAIQRLERERTTVQ